MRELARWNGERDCWETAEVDLLSWLPVVFTETWPASATIRNNVLYELPMSAHHTDGSGSLFSQHDEKILPTPVAQPSGNSPDDHLRKKPGREVVTDLAIIVENGLLETGGRLLKTPTAQLAINGGSQHPDKRRAGGHGPTLADEVEHLLPDRLLPTPTTMEHLPARTGEAMERARRRGDPDGSRRERAGNLRERVVEELLPTPTAERPDGRKSAAFAEGRATYFDIIQSDKWGAYSEAIRRWEQVTGRPAPEPTEEGAKGGRRLSARFVEWMMGLPEGWVTAPKLGLSRVQQLRMLGNGVVKNQAVAALQSMRAARPINEGETR